MTRAAILKSSFLLILSIIALSLTACGSVDKEAKYPTGADRGATGNDIYSKPASVFGKGGLLGGSRSSEDAQDGSSGIAVNSFLWRAALDTVSFMPLASADPFGGTILTDWYSPPETPNERFKVNVFILGKQLRSDGVRVRVFKQVTSKKDAWIDAAVSADTSRQLEDSILTRARQLRLTQMGRGE